jgi:hypothetical protein
MSRVTADYVSGTCTGIAPPCTLSAWVRVYDVVSSQIVTVGTSGSANNYYALGLNASNKAQAIEKDTVNGLAISALTVSNNVWHNLTAVFTDHTNRAIFIDGANKVAAAGLRAAAATSFIGIMGDTISGGGWPADYAHVAIWNIALSDTEVSQLFAVGPAWTRPASLIEYWPLFGNLSPEPSTQTANSLTVAANYSSLDPFGNYMRVPYQSSRSVQL